VNMTWHRRFSPPFMHAIHRGQILVGVNIMTSGTIEKRIHTVHNTV
jgi:hypothetical protein